MAEQFYTLLTNVGQAKLANATALGTKVNFSKIKVGDSNGSYYNPTQEQENIKNKVWEGNINSITVDSKNKNWIIINTLIPANIGGFSIREIGIFDDEDNLLIISKYPETYKPLLENGSGRDLNIKLIVQVNNTESITLKLDPSITIATKEDFKKVEEKITELSLNTTKKIEEIHSENVDIAKQSLKQVSGTYVGNNSAQNIKIGITPSFIFISDKECKQFSITFKDFTVIFEDGKTPYMTITQIGCSIDYINLGSVMSDKGKIYNYYAIGQGEN